MLGGTHFFEKMYRSSVTLHTLSFQMWRKCNSFGNNFVLFFCFGFSQCRYIFEIVWNIFSAVLTLNVASLLLTFSLWRIRWNARFFLLQKGCVAQLAPLAAKTVDTTGYKITVNLHYYYFIKVLNDDVCIQGSGAAMSFFYAYILTSFCSQLSFSCFRKKDYPSHEST